jgi:hypothetical protein
MADKSRYSIVTYERRPGHWRAAITPIRRSGTLVHSQTITSIVTPDDLSPSVTLSLQPKRWSRTFKRYSNFFRMR